MNKTSKEILNQTIIDKQIEITIIKNSMVNTALTLTQIKGEYKNIEKLEKEIKELKEDLNE